MRENDTTNYVCECNRAFNAETRHPMVSLIDMSAPCIGSHVATDCYAVVMKSRAGDACRYGWKYYDYTDATLLFIAPHKEIDLATSEGKMLIFHPDLIRCTPLGMRLREYSFFKYRQDESLHISCCEERVIRRCLGCVDDELRWGVDVYSKEIICNIIELLLNYCRRFYERQFVTRHNANVDAIAALDSVIDRAFTSGEVARRGLPTAGRLAPGLGMSADYLNDMLKSETGKAVGDYVQLRRISLAKQMLLAGRNTVGEISAMLGFCTERCFATVFKKITGCAPEEFF